MWGCPDGYYLHHGECYRLYPNYGSYPEAEIACSIDGGILAKPMSFMQSEFLESFVDFSEDLHALNFTQVWLGHRIENVSEDSLQDLMLGLL